MRPPQKVRPFSFLNYSRTGGTAAQSTPRPNLHHSARGITREHAKPPAGRCGAADSAAATRHRCSLQPPPPPASHQRNRSAERTHHAHGAREYAESTAKPPGPLRRSGSEPTAPVVATPFLRGASARRRGHRGYTPSRRGTDMARIDDDDDDDPRAPPLPPPPRRRAALCRCRSRFHRPASSTYLPSRAPCALRNKKPGTVVLR